MSNFSSSPSLKTTLKAAEGFRGRPYRDSRGIWTIGYGHNLEASPLCEAALAVQLDCDIEVAQMALFRRLPWAASQPSAIQDTLTELAFNMGIDSLVGFHATLAAIQAADYKAAAAHLLDSAYAKQVPHRANRLAEVLRSMV